MLGDHPRRTTWRQSLQAKGGRGLLPRDWKRMMSTAILLWRRRGGTLCVWFSTRVLVCSIGRVFYMSVNAAGAWTQVMEPTHDRGFPRESSCRRWAQGQVGGCLKRQEQTGGTVAIMIRCQQHVCISRPWVLCEAGVVFYFLKRVWSERKHRHSARRATKSLHLFVLAVESMLEFFGQDVVGRGFCVEFINSSGAEVWERFDVEWFRRLTGGELVALVLSLRVPLFVENFRGCTGSDAPTTQGRRRAATDAGPAQSQVWAPPTTHPLHFHLILNEIVIGRNCRGVRLSLYEIVVG